MALEFLTDAEIGDCGLVIRLDLEGVHALMRTLETAMEARLEAVELQGGGDTADCSAASAFARVSVVLVESAPEDRAGASDDGRRAGPAAG
jgi:hypothetical protein